MRDQVIRSSIQALAVLSLVAAPKAASAADTWAFYTYHPVATTTVSKVAAKMAEDIQAQTNGALNVKIHLGGSLQISATNITQAVADNIVQMGDDSFNAGNIKIAGILRLPMLMRNEDEYATAARIMTPYIEGAYRKKGILVLGQYVYPTLTLWSRKPLESLADAKGQKIRVMSPEQGEFIKRFGSVPVTMGTPDVPPALDRGVVDGVFTSTAGSGYTWRDLLKYNYRLGVSYIDSFIIVNQGAFEKLSAADQDKIRRIVQDGTKVITATMRGEEADLTQKMVQGGLKVSESRSEDATEAEKRIESYWNDWAKAAGSEAAEALSKVRAALKR